MLRGDDRSCLLSPLSSILLSAGSFAGATCAFCARLSPPQGIHVVVTSMAALVSSLLFPPVRAAAGETQTRSVPLSLFFSSRLSSIRLVCDRLGFRRSFVSREVLVLCHVRDSLTLFPWDESPRTALRQRNRTIGGAKAFSIGNSVLTHNHSRPYLTIWGLPPSPTYNRSRRFTSFVFPSAGHWAPPTIEPQNL